MSETLIYLAGFVVLIAAGVAMAILAVRRDGRGVGDMLKQLVIWVGIVSLLPLSGYAGAAMLHLQKPMKDLIAERSRAQQEQGNVRNGNNNDPAAQQAAQQERSKWMDKQQELTKRIEEETRLFNRTMFRVAFPIGLASIVVGITLVRIVCVGTSLALGGLGLLSFGCYSYWDDMGDAARFFSLVATLAVLIGIGLAKFRNAPAPAA